MGVSLRRKTRQFLRTPDAHIDEAHLCLGETWIYEGGRASQKWEMEGRSVIQEREASTSDGDSLGA